MAGLGKSAARCWALGRLALLSWREAPRNAMLAGSLLACRFSCALFTGLAGLVAALRDVPERQAAAARLRFLAHHDMLTKLPNRLFLTASIENALRAAPRTGGSFAVLCLDLDGFRLVNGTLGYAVGDELLCLVARRLRDSIREGDFVARVGGDEFVVLQIAGVQPEDACALA